jgi:ParB-like chromosome segregation protein Spo0J
VERAGLTIAELSVLLRDAIGALPEDERVAVLNEARAMLHEVSPLKHHPVDFVRWARAEDVQGNTYNPNAVAPPEFKLLVHSVNSNGYTMPIVTHEGPDGTVIVDGFHRSRVGKEVPSVRESTRGYLPVTRCRSERADDASRIAATIEHNRARGEHRVDQMSELVRMLYQAGWRDNKIQEELGMTADEVRRMKQITGLSELFASREYSQAWEAPP